MNAETVQRTRQGGRANRRGSLEDLVRQLEAPRAVWVMLPAGRITEETVDASGRVCSQPGDIIIDGGNTLLQGRHPPREDARAARASTTSMSAPPAASGAWSAAIA